MPESKRAADIEQLDTRITTLQRDLAALRDLVDDLETVVDKHGYLPADRREISRIGFMLWREREVRRLRESVADLGERLAVKGLGKAERAELRRKFNADRGELDKFLGVPPQSAADMCSECERPLSWHGYSRSSGQPWGVVPCPACPDWAQRIQKARDMLIGLAAERHTSAPEPPKPLAVIPSGLPIAEVLKCLAEIQTKHPYAEVRRGARNKWEVSLLRGRRSSQHPPSAASPARFRSSWRLMMARPEPDRGSGLVETLGTTDQLAARCFPAGRRTSTIRSLPGIRAWR